MRLPPGTDLLLTTFPALSQIQHLIGDLFSRTRYVVVDEADLLLSGEGSPVARYRPRQLLEQLQQATASPSDLANPQRQFVFVGATMPAGRHTAREYINSRFSPVKMLYSSGSHQPVRTLTQQWITFPSSNKAESLVMDQDVNNGDSLHEEKCQELFNLLREDRQHSKILVFTNTTESTEQTYASLRSLLDQNPNLAASTRLLRLHSALARTERQLAVSQFTASSSNNADELSASETTFDKSTTIMIAGDVVARGFDFADVDRVVQFDFSLNMVQYLHRIGRTARGGRQGEVVNFIGPQDVRLSNHIQHALANNQPLDATYDEQEGDGTGLINEKSPVDQTAFARLFSRNRSLRKRDRRKLSHQQQISASA
jgi:superfamily II DNA/RNA helicase